MLLVDFFSRQNVFYGFPENYKVLVRSMSSATCNVGLILYIKTIPLVTLTWLCSYICKFMSIARIFKYILAHAHNYILILHWSNFQECRKEESACSTSSSSRKQIVWHKFIHGPAPINLNSSIFILVPFFKGPTDT